MATSEREASKQALLETIEMYNRVYGFLRQDYVDVQSVIEVLKILQLMRQHRNNIVLAMKKFILEEPDAFEFLDRARIGLQDLERDLWHKAGQQALAEAKRPLDGLVESYVDHSVLDEMKRLAEELDRAKVEGSVEAVKGILGGLSRLQTTIVQASKRASVDFFARIGMGILAIFTAVGVGIVFQITRSMLMFALTVLTGGLATVTLYSFVKRERYDTIRNLALLIFVITEASLLAMGRPVLDIVILAIFALLLLLLTRRLGKHLREAYPLLEIMHDMYSEERDSVVVKSLRDLIPEEL